MKVSGGDSMMEKVDFVIPWVDGADPAHREKRKAYRDERDPELPGSNAATRFADTGELEYCVRSIIKFCPWVNRIFILTDSQIPGFLQRGGGGWDKLKVIDHKELFKGFEKYLPTFNSRSIGTVAWRVPGLSDKFIYMNDDFILTAPLALEDFFCSGKPVIRGQWKRLVRNTIWARLKRRIKRFADQNQDELVSRNPEAQTRGALLAGINERFFFVNHVPVPSSVTTFKEFFLKYPEVFQKNISYRFRSSEQFTAFSLGVHLDIKSGNAVLQPDMDRLTIHGRKDSDAVAADKIKQVCNGNTRFLCLQSLDVFDVETIRIIYDELDKLLK